MAVDFERSELVIILIRQLCCQFLWDYTFFVLINRDPSQVDDKNKSLNIKFFSRDRGQTIIPSNHTN